MHFYFYKRFVFGTLTSIHSPLGNGICDPTPSGGSGEKELEMLENPTEKWSVNTGRRWR